VLWAAAVEDRLLDHSLEAQVLPVKATTVAQDIVHHCTAVVGAVVQVEWVVPVPLLWVVLVAQELI